MMVATRSELIIAKRIGQRGFADIVIVTVLAVIGPALACLTHHLAACPAVQHTHAMVAAPVASVERELRAAASREGVPYRLVHAVAVHESLLLSTAVSPTGGVGVMQIEPEVASDCGVRNPYDVHQNIVCGVRLLRSLLARYAWDVRRAIAAYNFGPSAVDRTHPSRGEPLETKRYVEAVMETYAEQPS